jgi:hypothetical protein
MKSKIGHIFKTTINYIGIYSAGVIISASFVLVTNDIFYNSVFKQLIQSTPESRNQMWQEIKPRELYNTGAKTTFIKNMLQEEKEDEQMRYHAYIEKRKRLAQEGVDKEEKIYENIYEKNEKI